MTSSCANLSIIAAVADNRVIGRNNQLPWHLPEDLQHFKRLTLGKPILMGRKTWESLPGLLPGREHWIMTRDMDYQAPGGHVVHSLTEALRKNCRHAEMMLIGGAHLYAQAIPLAMKMYLTEVHQRPEGDAFFPVVDLAEWREVSRKAGADGDYEFVEWERFS